jgi:hypothetical protein
MLSSCGSLKLVAGNGAPAIGLAAAPCDHDAMWSKTDRMEPLMRMSRLSFIGAYVLLSGCVIGYGPCLFQQPVKNTLTGRVHFRDYPGADGVDNVPVLALDRTAYVYAPAQSHHCLSANDLQLVGVAEFPQNVIENSHVVVDGVIFQASSARQHTPFLMNVTTVLPIPAQH